MAIQAGETTFYQAKRGIVQNGLVLNLDTGVEGYTSTSSVISIVNGDTASFANQASLQRERGGYIALDGTDDYCSIPNNSNIKPAMPFTFGMWFRKNGTTSGYLYRSDNSSNYYGFWVSVSTGIKAWLGNGGGPSKASRWNNNTLTGSQSNKVWYYFTVEYKDTFSDTAFNPIHINASNVTPTYSYSNNNGSATSFNASNSQDSLMSINNGSASPFDGDIGPIHIYKRELSASEITHNYNTTRHRFGV